MRGAIVLAGALALGVSCAGDSVAPPPPPPPSIELGCTAVREVALAAGRSILLDANLPESCVRLPFAAGSEEYLLAVFSAAPDLADDGVSASFQLRSAGPAPAALHQAPIVGAGPSHRAEPTRDLHDWLRAGERSIAGRVRHRPPAAAAPGLAPPVREFGVCANLTCSEVAMVPATAVYQGSRVVVYLEDNPPPDGFSAADLTRLGVLFDNYLVPADTSAFGSPSDVDGNGVIYLVITSQVNRLCFDAGGLVSGYFYGRDLIPEEPGSNGAEVFFAFAPDPTGVAGCRVTAQFVERTIPGTFVHEFQHMISFGQHVLQRGGPPEETWLNEGLSHLAEELAGRRVPDDFCTANDCFSQFSFNDVSNAYRYLEAPESFFLVYPIGSSGRLAERGASFLLVRWLRDHFGSGDDLTRRLLATTSVGAANVAAAAGQPWDELLGLWHLANYLDDLPGFAPGDPKLAYSSWNWRVTFPSLRAQYPGLYSRSFPTAPDSVGPGFDYSGTLRGGSGRYFRAGRPAGGSVLDLRLGSPGGGALPTAIHGRLAIARIR
ncbi:MAG: hypothetical protein R2882_04230 [Gemmatimonadales bacterium]